MFNFHPCIYQEWHYPMSDPHSEISLTNLGEGHLILKLMLWMYSKLFDINYLLMYNKYPGEGFYLWNNQRIH